MPGTRRVLMAAGGTGGHIFPALAVADELRARWTHDDASRHSGETRSRIEFIGTGRPLEQRLIPAAGYRLRNVAAAGLVGIGWWKKLQNLLVLPQSFIEAARVLTEFQPDVVVGVGGYGAGPVMLEAALRDIPTLLIEPNAVPGFTNRMLAPVARLAAVGFEEAAPFYGTKAVVTGHAIRKAFGQVPTKDHLPPFTVLILGGSQGAKVINDCVVKALSQCGSRAASLRWIHQTGEREYSRVCEACLGQEGLMLEVIPFIDDVPAVLARADLVVSRSGALSVAELAAAGKASIFIPFAAAAEHHQSANARVAERAGAARVIEQAELTPERLLGEIWRSLDDLQRLRQMEQRARLWARPGAAERIADMVEDLAGGEGVASQV
ncbi:MAG TPA: undecaprenyldiphospho-muramoylpentapeptide beta-N-acetylglucosaminyltransferase [Terriglobia bacterium]|nr:undecaprenyldiphospho-muramoylpentapeptide beta-N-acetylglucosaminyltransferase [Terriglobia bacterium]